MMTSILFNTEPISLNSMYRGRRYLNQRGKAAKLGMELECRNQYKAEMRTDDVCVNVIFYFKDNHRRDIDSHLKALLDSMTGIVYEDDSQVNELHVYKYVDKKNPRVEVSVV